ncbi:MAG: ImmA/IrrE family metallo-endopeptidase [Thiotrichales bacterium]
MTAILADNLLRLRKNRGDSQGKLAEAVGLSMQAYRNLEKGISQPRRDTLTALAQALDVRLPELLKPARKLERVRFRSLKKLKRRDQILVEVAQWLEDFASLEQLTGERTDDGLEPIWAELAATGQRDIPALAAHVRERFGLAPGAPVHDICGLLESKGIKVFSRSVASDAFMGLSIAAGDGGPAVVVNTWERLPVETWIFSAAHELAHLILHLSAYDVREDHEEPQQEKAADAFASHFLMPHGAFLSEWLDAEGLPLIDRVLKIKRVFRVSWRTVLYRIAEQLPEDKRPIIWRDFNLAYQNRHGRSLLKHDEPDGISEEIYQSAQGQRPVGIEPAGMDRHDFQGDRLWRLVRHAIEQEKITLSRGAEILNLSLAEMRDLSAGWLR